MIRKCLSYALLAGSLLAAGCANITSPTGGKKDVIPPKRLSVTPADSLTNTRLKKVELTFDEYITVTDASKEVQISPLLSINPTVTGLKKKVTVKIPDSLLEPNTTYRISFGNAIKDLHEGNPFGGYIYTFSTGAWFDSLQLAGNVLNAATGLADSAGVLVVLYYATDGDSAIVRKKPRYVAHADAKGNFSFAGLPKKAFKIYAIKDANDNMMFDGDAEMIGFTDNDITPGGATSTPALTLRMFMQAGDTSIHADAEAAQKPGMRRTEETSKPQSFGYSVNVDSQNKAKRTFDINGDLRISFTRIPELNNSRITLTYDSNGTEVPAVFDIRHADTSKDVRLHTQWKENTQYTLKLAKGFAKDSAGTEPMPAKFIFRTKEDEDYGKIIINIPAKYAKKYLLQVTADNDTVYQKVITDTSVVFTRMKPVKYTFRLIEDRNGNGKWDAGDLFLKLQPEEVVPYREPLFLRPGWENVIDFETKPIAPKPARK
jgi:hypothetical protein